MAKWTRAGCQIQDPESRRILLVVRVVLVVLFVVNRLLVVAMLVQMRLTVVLQNQTVVVIVLGLGVQDLQLLLGAADLDGLLYQMLILLLNVDGHGMVMMELDALVRRGMLVVHLVVQLRLLVLWLLVVLVLVSMVLVLLMLLMVVVVDLEGSAHGQEDQTGKLQDG